MNQTPTENFVIFVALLLLYVQTSAQHYIAADGLGGESLKGKSLYADVAHHINRACTAPTIPCGLFHTPKGDAFTNLPKWQEERANGVVSGQDILVLAGRKTTLLY